jgi:hypothetical protein
MRSARKAARALVDAGSTLVDGQDEEKLIRRRQPAVVRRAH